MNFVPRMLPRPSAAAILAKARRRWRPLRARDPNRRVHLAVELLEDRTNPAAIGLDPLDLSWLTQQQFQSFQSNVLEARFTAPSVINVFDTRTTPAAPAPGIGHEVIIVDAGVGDLGAFLSQLEEGLPPGRWYDLYVVDADHGGVEQITEILSRYQRQLDAVHLFTHGSSGELWIGGDRLNGQTMSSFANDVAAWGAALAPYGDLLLYGCDVAAGGQGQAFVEQLHILTGVDVAASTNATGTSSLGGDWILETHLGEIGAAGLHLNDRPDAWTGLLATYTVHNRNDSGIGSLRQAIIDANANAGQDTIQFLIPGVGTQVISLASALPTITDSVILDGSTQLGYTNRPLIVLDGSGTTGHGLVLSANNSTIRGLAIVNWSGDGLRITGNNNLVAGVFSGIDATGTSAQGNQGDGLKILSGANNNIIGGTTAADRNIFSGNAGDGIELDNGDFNTILGNRIGTNAAGTGNVGNGENGLRIRNGSSDNMIGGTASGSGNVVAFNGQTGLLMNGSSTVANQILGNTFFSNGGLGIDLSALASGGDGVTLNDPLDADGGPNHLKNYPVLSSATSTGSSITIVGSLNSVAVGNYRIEFFANSAPDSTGFGEGERYLGAVTVTTDASGNASFSPTFNIAVAPGESITATNTDLDRRVTSEFAANLLANALPVIVSNGGGASANVNVNENTTTVTTVSATDADGDTPTYSLAGGADSGYFAIDPDTGVLRFTAAPDFETPADANGDNTYIVIVQVSDGNGGIATQTLFVSVVNVNDPPVLTLPDSQTTPVNAPIVLSVANGNAISVSDVDAGTNPIRVTLSVANGVLTLSGIAGLTFTQGDGANDATMTFSGSQAAVNVALNGLRYNPANNFIGSDTLSVTVNDLGNSGSGGAQIVAGSIILESVIEFRGNTTINQNQRNVGVAMDASGNFVMVWEADSNLDGDGDGIFAQRFDNTGARIGGEFRVNTTTNDDQTEPVVAMDANGNFVVIWTSKNQDGNGKGIYGQRFNAAGVPIGGEFRVNTSTSGNQDAPAVAMTPTGGFAVAWRSDRGGSGSDVYVQNFDASGNAVGVEIRANSNLTDNQDQPAIAVDAAGNTVVVWRSSKQDTSGAGVFGRMFNAAGNALGAEFQVNTTNSGNQDKPAVARSATGEFVVVWASGNNQDGDKTGVYGRRFAADGTAQGSEFLVNTTTVEAQDRPTVGIDNQGNFVVAWQSDKQDGHEKGIFARRFLANGTPAAGEFRVNGTTQKQQQRPALAVNGIGDLVVAWQGNGIGDTSGVFGQLYRSVNDAPGISAPGAQSTAKNTNLAFSAGAGNAISISDSDAGNSPVRISLSVAHGTLTLSQLNGLTFLQGDGVADSVIVATGSLSAINAALAGLIYTPAASYSGPDTLAINVDDLGNTGTGGSKTANANVAITVVNNAPVAGNNSYSTNEDTASVVSLPGLLGNDSDADGDSLTAVLVNGPSHGTLSLNSDGTFTYTPDANFFGVDSFTYRASDGSLSSNLATVTITVNAVNDAPVAADDNYTIAEDNTLTVGGAGVLANDSDVDGPITAVLVTGPSSGTLTLNPDGTFTYTPDANFFGTDSFTYRATDGSLSSNLATVTITVTAVNDAPVAVDDSYTIAEDNTLTVGGAGVLANDSDIENSPLTAVLVSGPSSGTLTLNQDGTFTYTPDANFFGVDSFTYRASDGSLSSNLATVTITVNAVNDAPVAADDNYTIAEDNTLTVGGAGVLTNDSDVDGPITAVLVTGPSSGTLTLNSDGTFTYTPDANFFGTDSFTYRATDGSLSSNLATVTITVTAVNDAPVAVDDNYTIAEDNTLSVGGAGVLANDSDIENSPLTAVLVSGPSSGTLTLNPDGTFTYTPDANFFGVDSFTYRASDGSLSSNLATVTITVNAVNDAPVAADDNYTIAEDNTLTVGGAGVLANDSDVDGPITAVLVTGPSSGTLTLNPDGTFTYTPDANFFGTDSFTYRATDGSLSSNLATVTITVNAVNDAPVAGDDNYTIAEDNTLTVGGAGVLANDSDIENSPLTAVLVNGPSSGTLTLNQDGTFTYTPDANFFGTDSFTYRATDGSLSSNLATVTITVNAVNDAPVAADDNYTIAEDNTLTVGGAGVLANDSDVDGPITAVLVTGPSSGTLTLNQDGTFTYTPDANFFGTDSFTYRATDGSLSSNLATVTITVTAVNDAPVAVDDNYTIAEDNTLTVGGAGVLANDSDIENSPLTAVLVSGPSSGTLTLNQDGTFTYTPDANFFGTDSFTYRATDGSLSSNLATVTITVTAVNDVPTVAGASFTLDEDSRVVMSAPGLLGGAADIDGDPLTAVLVAGPKHGQVVVQADGSFVYIPAADYHGRDSFSFAVSDGLSQSAPAVVQFTIASVNDAPVFIGSGPAALSFIVTASNTLTISAADISRYFRDVDGDVLTSRLLVATNHGDFVRNADGSFTFTPFTGFLGIDQFVFAMSDGSAESVPVIGRVIVAEETMPPPPLAPASGPILENLYRIVPQTGPIVGGTTGIGSNSGAGSEAFGVGGEESSEQVVQRVAAAGRFDAPNDSKDAPPSQPPVVVARADVERSDDGSRSQRLYIPLPIAPTVSPPRFVAQAWRQQTTRLFEELDNIADNIAEHSEQRRAETLIVGGAAAVMSTGYVVWSLRTIYVLLGALTARPLWRTFDPLLILDRWEKTKDDDDVEKMFD